MQQCALSQAFGAVLGVPGVGVGEGLGAMGMGWKGQGGAN